MPARKVKVDNRQKKHYLQYSVDSSATLNYFNKLRRISSLREKRKHIVARPVRKKTNWVFAVGRLTACDALAASLCGLVVRVGECGEVSKTCTVKRAASAVVSSSPFVQQASLGSSSGGWMTPAAGWNLSRPHNGRQWLNRSVLTYSRGSEPLALRRRAQ